MKQGLLAFQYEEEKSTTGMTALSGLMTYVELMHVRRWSAAWVCGEVVRAGRTAR